MKNVRRYGLRFLYEGNLSGEYFYEDRELRDDVFEGFVHAPTWDCVMQFKNACVNMKHVIFVEKVAEVWDSKGDIKVVSEDEGWN